MDTGVCRGLLCGRLTGEQERSSRESNPAVHHRQQSGFRDRFVVIFAHPLDVVLGVAGDGRAADEGADQEGDERDFADDGAPVADLRVFDLEA